MTQELRKHDLNIASQTTTQSHVPQNWCQLLLVAHARGEQCLKNSPFLFHLPSHPFAPVYSFLNSFLFSFFPHSISLSHTHTLPLLSSLAISPSSPMTPTKAFVKALLPHTQGQCSKHAKSTILFPTMAPPTSSLDSKLSF